MVTWVRPSTNEIQESQSQTEYWPELLSPIVSCTKHITEPESALNPVIEELKTVLLYSSTIQKSVDPSC